MNKTLSLCTAVLGMLAVNAALAQQVIVPEVERREVKLPKFPSKDIAVGLFAGTYATQNFGAAAVVGGRLGYHVTEDWFVEATLGQSKVSDEVDRGGLGALGGGEHFAGQQVVAGRELVVAELFLRVGEDAAG